jgi:hypothetical protein
VIECINNIIIYTLIANTTKEMTIGYIFGLVISSVDFLKLFRKLLLLFVIDPDNIEFVEFLGGIVGDTS